MAAFAPPLQPMYRLKPVYADSLNMDLPTCMYRSANVHFTETENKTSEKTTITESVSKHSLPEGIVDFVISISPKQSSLTPVFIAEILKRNGVDVVISTHLHSSLQESVPQELLKVTGGLTGRLRVLVKHIVFTFVWKNDSFCPSLMYSPLLQTRIYGDANIARYLCRVLQPDLYNENDNVAAVQIDRWLDNSTQMSHGSTKQKDAAMKSLNSHLGKCDYLCNEHMTLADIATFAAIITNKSCFKTLPKNVKEWFMKISQSFSDTVKLLDVQEA